MMATPYISLGLVPNGKRSVSPIPASILGMVPKPEGKNTTIKDYNADPVKDTVPLIQRLAKRQAWQGKRLAQHLTGSSLAETVRNNWDFFIKHIQYKKDVVGKEQVRSLRRLVHNAAEGGDCDCFVNGLANLLINQGIDFKLRIAKYNGNPDYSHIYIVVPTGNGKYITLDPVVHQFNYEVPYTDKKDFSMKLESLDGYSTRGRGMGACPTNNTTQSGSTTDTITTQKRLSLVTKDNIQALNLQSTYDVLDGSNIPYTTSISPDNDLIIQAQTANGILTLPSVLDKQQAEQLKLAATQPTTTAKASGPELKQAGIVVGGMALLGLLAWAFSGSNNDKKAA